MSNTCLGGAHVHKGAFQIGLVGIVASVLTECFYFNEPVKPYFHITLALIAFFCYLAILLGYHTEKLVFYMPFFILTPFFIVAQILNALLIFFIVGISLTTGRRQIVEDPELNHIYQFVRANPGFTYDALRPPSVWVIVLGVVYLVCALVQGYFYWVMIRSARYLRKLRSSRFLEEVTWSRQVYN